MNTITPKQARELVEEMRTLDGCPSHFGALSIDCNACLSQQSVYVVRQMLTVGVGVIESLAAAEEELRERVNQELCRRVVQLQCRIDKLESDAEHVIVYEGDGVLWDRPVPPGYSLSADAVNARIAKATAEMDRLKAVAAAKSCYVPPNANARRAELEALIRSAGEEPEVFFARWTGATLPPIPKSGRYDHAELTRFIAYQLCREGIAAWLGDATSCLAHFIDRLTTTISQLSAAPIVDSLRARATEHAPWVPGDVPTWTAHVEQAARPQLSAP